MSGMLVSDIITRVQRQFGDEAQSQITQADIIRWINDAMVEIAIQNDLLQVKGSMDSVANQAAYTLPNGVAKLQSVKYLGLPLRYISPEQADEMLLGKDQTQAQGYPVGTPIYYWIYANQINLMPMPDSAVVAALTIYYTRQPTLIANVNDDPELPDQYDNRIVEYCLAQAYEMDENFFISMMKKQSFDQGVTNLKQTGWDNQDTYPYITSPSEDMGPPAYDYGGY